MKEKTVIIGGGISGITTGIVLQLLGRETKIYAEHLVGDGSDSDPRFASAYPAASVIPHSVHTDRLETLFSDSMKVFEALYNKGFSGMEVHRHYEIYEFPVEEPRYVHHLKNYIKLSEVADAFIPKRAGIDNVFGRAFDCYVAEWPMYIKALYSFYEETGGVIHHKKMERDDVRTFSSNVIINCAGVWSGNLFGDELPEKIVRGHIIHAENMPKVRDSRGRICSYNYTAAPSVYSTPGGDPCDVYFYPVGSKWIIGGSRQDGILDKQGNWAGKETEDTITVNGIEVPAQIIALNNEILENTYHTKIPPVQKLRSFTGYRFERGGDRNGLRLSCSRELGKKIVHNYGHGGAGVTLSWGCALRAAQLLHINTTAKTAAKALASRI